MLCSTWGEFGSQEIATDAPQQSNDDWRFSMFALNVTVRLKPNTMVDFNNTHENEILPLLRQRKGFRDELVLVAPNGTDAVGISLWDNKENADAYQKEGYPDIKKRLTKLIEGPPHVQTYEVPFSTFHKVTAGAGGSRSGS
jgi:hypothetical protein